jgi:hypothetical protein
MLFHRPGRFPLSLLAITAPVASSLKQRAVHSIEGASECWLGPARRCIEGISGRFARRAHLLGILRVTGSHRHRPDPGGKRGLAVPHDSSIVVANARYERGKDLWGFKHEGRGLGLDAPRLRLHELPVHPSRQSRRA